MEKKTFGIFLAALRKANGLTQKELADQLNVSDKAISRWERDESLPDVSLLPVIADIFDVTVDELLRGERKCAVSESNREASEKEIDKSKKRVATIMKGCISSFMQWNILVTGIVFTLVVIGWILVSKTKTIGLIFIIGGALLGIVFNVFYTFRMYSKMKMQEEYLDLSMEYQNKLKRIGNIFLTFLLFLLFPPLGLLYGVILFNRRFMNRIEADESKKKAKRKVIKNHCILTAFIIMACIELIIEDGLFLAPRRIFWNVDSLVTYLEKNVKTGRDDANSHIENINSMNEMLDAVEYGLCIYGDDGAVRHNDSLVCPIGGGNSMQSGKLYRLMYGKYTTDFFEFRNEKAELILFSSNGFPVVVTTNTGSFIGLCLTIGLICLLALWILFNPWMVSQKVLKAESVTADS